MLCLSVMPPDWDAVACLFARFPEGVDAVEIRLDRIGATVPFGLLADRPARVIVACRSHREGGVFRGSEEERLTALAGSVANGADLADLELEAVAAGRRSGLRGDHLIVSHHDREGTPEDLEGVLRRALSCAPRIVKIATHARALSDNFRPLDLLARWARGGRLPGGTDLAAFCLGEKGKLSRLLAHRHGSAIDYVSLDGEPTGPGQYTLAEWRDAAPPGGADGPLYALLGRSLAHAASPRLQNALLRAIGESGSYVALPCDDFAEGWETVERIACAGLNVTFPYKEEARGAARALGWSARLAGAVNCLCRRCGEPTSVPRSPASGGPFFYKGFNTDGPALVQTLRRAAGADWPGGRRVLILGAGGAAKTAARFLVRRGAVVFLSARDRGRTERAAAASGAAPVPWRERGDFRGDLVVNATPAGQWPEEDENPIDPRVFRHVQAAFDLVYNPPGTRFLRAAREAGRLAVSGVDMLVEQAVRSLRLWTGRCVAPAARATAAGAFFRADIP